MFVPVIVISAMFAVLSLQKVCVSLPLASIGAGVVFIVTLTFILPKLSQPEVASV